METLNMESPVAKRVAGIGLLLMLCFAGSTPAAEEASFLRTLQWISPKGDREVPGLFLVETSRLGMVSRLLLQSPGGRSIVLTQNIDPNTGKTAVRLLDDATGWWAELTYDLGIHEETLKDFFRRARALSAGVPLPATLSVAGRNTFQAIVPSGLDDVTARAFVVDLEAAGKAKEFVEEIPEDLWEALGFIEASVSPDLLPRDPDEKFAWAMRPIALILLEAGRASGLEVASEKQVRWSIEILGWQKGLTIIEPEWLDFVSQFRSVENANPLEGSRVAEVFGDGGR